MANSGTKEKMLNVRVPEKFLEDYKNFCECNSWILSKRIRKLMQADMDKWNRYLEDQKKSV